MTDGEKLHFREVHAQMQIGYRLAEEERIRRVRTTSTAEGILSLRRAFQEAAHSQPPRESSGLVEFYKALYRSR